MITNLSSSNINSFDNDNPNENLFDSINKFFCSNDSFFSKENEYEFLLGNENINNTNIYTQKTPKINFDPDIFNEENNLRLNNTTINKKRKRGRRKKEEKEKEKNEDDQIYHDKYQKDNILRKIKHISIESCFNYVNDILKKIYKMQIPKTKLKFEYQLIKLNHELVKDIKIDVNRFIAKQTIKWILTNNKCTKFKRYDNNHNKILIEKSLKKCSEQDRKKLELLFNMSFSEYLELYCGKKNEYSDILEGLITFEQYCNSDDFKEKNPDHEQYKECLKDYLYNFENYLKVARERKPRKKRDNYIVNNDI